MHICCYGICMQVRAYHGAKQLWAPQMLLQARVRRGPRQRSGRRKLIEYLVHIHIGVWRTRGHRCRWSSFLQAFLHTDSVTVLTLIFIFQGFWFCFLIFLFQKPLLRLLWLIRCWNTNAARTAAADTAGLCWSPTPFSTLQGNLVASIQVLRCNFIHVPPVWLAPSHWEVNGPKGNAIRIPMSLKGLSFAGIFWSWARAVTGRRCLRLRAASIRIRIFIFGFIPFWLLFNLFTSVSNCNLFWNFITFCITFWSIWSIWSICFFESSARQGRLEGRRLGTSVTIFPIPRPLRRDGRWIFSGDLGSLGQSMTIHDPSDEAADLATGQLGHHRHHRHHRDVHRDVHRGHRASHGGYWGHFICHMSHAACPHLSHVSHVSRTCHASPVAWSRPWLLRRSFEGAKSSWTQLDSVGLGNLSVVRGQTWDDLRWLEYLEWTEAAMWLVMWILPSTSECVQSFSLGCT